MTTCLLCSAHAVADFLCVECGAKKWAASLWSLRPTVAQELLDDVDYYGFDGPRNDAMRELRTPETSHAFLARLEAARKTREGTP